MVSGVNSQVIGTDLIFGDAELQAAVSASMEQAETLLMASVRAQDDFLHSISGYLAEAGGKRFRPLVTILASHFGDPSAPGVVESATVMELTHLATLYHDDVMDEATVRRGQQAANVRWDNTIAILTGDFLFSRASALLADLGPEAVRIQARTFERLVTGQIRETVGPLPGVDSIDHHLDVLANKTGSLIAASVQLGALFSGVPAADVEALTLYAELMGVAFQLSDDILDIASDSEESGKTPGTDLREGIPTLPVLFALAGTDPDEARLRSLISAPITDDALHAEALAALRVSPAMAQARAQVADYSDRATAALGELPPSAARDAFEALSAYLQVRTA